MSRSAISARLRMDLTSAQDELLLRTRDLEESNQRGDADAAKILAARVKVLNSRIWNLKRTLRLGIGHLQRGQPSTG